MNIHVVNGPNLNLLGKREPAIYGTTTLKEINRELEDLAFCNNAQISFFQSNHEGQIIDYLQQLKDDDRVVLNPGGLAHYSVSLRDCIAAIAPQVVEVHLSNIAAREDFRQKSLISPVCTGVISGFGVDVYRLAITWFLERN